MARTQSNRVRSSRQIQALILYGTIIQRTLQLIDLLLRRVLQIIEQLTHLFLLLVGDVPEIVEQGRNLPLLAQIFDTESLQILLAGSVQLLYLIKSSLILSFISFYKYPLYPAKLVFFCLLH